MSNIIDTYEGNSAAVRTVCITWNTRDGKFIYHPDPEESIKVRVFDSKGNTIAVKEAEFEDEEVLITFPDDLQPGDYDYEITIRLKENEKPLTVLSSKIHVRRR